MNPETSPTIQLKRRLAEELFAELAGLDEDQQAAFWSEQNRLAEEYLSQLLPVDAPPH